METYVKHPDQQKTRNGAKFIPLGQQRNLGSEKNPRIYVYAQMLPVHPQRFEWIAQRNIVSD